MMHASRPAPATDVMALRAALRGDATLARARHLAPEALDALRNLADQARRAHRLDVARALLEGLVALDPRDAWAGLALAELCLGAGDVAGARVAVAGVEASERGNGGIRPETALTVGRVLLAERRVEEARTWLALAATDSRASRQIRALARALHSRASRRSP